ncbi:PREDICTED: uncharacterized protein LOC105449759 [Wasmannia auropunctata]|uniref:uncharacterized protein LOC105449759 n=1 Tax=Wasmannia auropunctata TaxID=64793 RepID=UPI0005EF6814|nr:PREDICTED: uncharacterized protein LOC105449759 [Wasmannia auropunctata]
MSFSKIDTHVTESDYTPDSGEEFNISGEYVTNVSEEAETDLRIQEVLESISESSSDELSESNTSICEIITEEHSENNESDNEDITDDNESIYCGNNKPRNVFKYLEKFINEINHLQQIGIIINNQQFYVSIKTFICDRPARAFLKCIIGHGGYWACERCTVKGIRKSNRVIYPITDVELRTDMSFRAQSNAEHHNDISPLLDIEPPIDMVQQFPLDSMHLVYLGVMKKLFDYWLNTWRNNTVKKEEDRNQKKDEQTKGGFPIAREKKEEEEKQQPKNISIPNIVRSNVRFLTHDDNVTSPIIPLQESVTAKNASTISSASEVNTEFVHVSIPLRRSPPKNEFTGNFTCVASTPCQTCGRLSCRQSAEGVDEVDSHRR